jgi:hypothetical protein
MEGLVYEGKKKQEGRKGERNQNEEGRFKKLIILMYF